MNYRCGYNGTASATQTERLNAETTIEWTRADPKVHIVKELVDNPIAMYEIANKYIVGAWCDEVQAFHADLLPAGDSTPTEGAT